jgi:hypothetical protein
MPRGRRRATTFAASALALLIALGGASSPQALEVRAKGELPCQGLAALGPAIDQRLGPDAATSEAGLRLRVQGRRGDRLHLALIGASGQVLFDRTVQSEALSCEDLVASLSLLASIWIRQTSSLASESHATRPGNLAPARPAAHPADAGVPLEVADAGSDLAALDAGPADEAERDAGFDAGPELPVDAGSTDLPDAGVPAPPAAVTKAELGSTDPWHWGVHLGAAVTGGVAVGDDGSLAPYVLGLRLDGSLYGPLRLELAGTYAGAFTDKLSPGQVQVQQDELALRVAVAPLQSLPHLYLLAGPTLDIVATSTSGYAATSSHTLLNGGGQIGARWQFAFSDRFSLEVGLIAELRAYRDALVVTRAGESNLTVGTVPPFWVLPEIGLHGDAL